jgi:ArsR family transcriptional regulator
MPTTARVLLPVRTKGCCAELPAGLSERAANRAAELFRALGDPTRVQMIHMLMASTAPVCVCDFTAAFELGQPTISHHLGKLRDAGLVSVSRQGIWAFYQMREDLGLLERAVLDQLG